MDQYSYGGLFYAVDFSPPSHRDITLDFLRPVPWNLSHALYLAPDTFFAGGQNLAGSGVDTDSASPHSFSNVDSDPARAKETADVIVTDNQGHREDTPVIATTIQVIEWPLITPKEELEIVHSPTLHRENVTPHEKLDDVLSSESEKHFEKARAFSAWIDPPAIDITMNKTVTSESSPQFWKTRYGMVAAVPTDTPVARSLKLYGQWAEQEIELLSAMIEEGYCVLELGGQYGAHTLWLSRAVGDSGKVHVADPGRISFQQMCANIAINGLSNVHTHPHWLGQSEGQVLPAFLPCALLNQHAHEIVQVKTLDSMGLDSLNLIKINVAGALNELLAGSVETIRKHRPVIYARLGGIEQAGLEVQTLKELGYRCWSHAPYFYQRENYAQQAANIFPGCVLQNVIASPVESRFEMEPHLEL